MHYEAVIVLDPVTYERTNLPAPKTVLYTYSNFAAHGRTSVGCDHYLVYLYHYILLA